MRRVHDLWRRGRRAARGALPDAELLDRFVRHGDHAAFAELVDRLGPLVYGACRRLLPNPADVEDAFQATFLVLVRRADALAGRAVGPWLHKVAVWTARNFRRRRALAAVPLDDRPLPASPPGVEATDARLDVDAAVSALPEKYRVAVILCHLQGWTRRELAAHLGCPESTASSLVGRGLAKLRKRLAGRDPAVVLALAGAAAVPAGLSASAVRAALLFRTSSLAAVSPAVAELTEGALRMFRVQKLTAAGAGLAVVAGVGLAIGLAAGLGPRADAQPPQPSQPDDLKAQRAKVDRDLEAAKTRLKELEAQKATLDERARQAATEPYIGLWVRPMDWPPRALAQRLGMDPTKLASDLLVQSQLLAGVGPRSEFAINEIYGKGKPVTEVHFYDVRSLQVYLTRAAKDPTAPKKLKLYIDKEYPAAKVKPVLEACKAAGFGAIELAVAEGARDVWGHLPERVRDKPKSALSPYVIEAPDLLIIEAILRNGEQTRPLPTQPVSGQFLVRPDGTVGLGFWGAVSVSGLTIDEAKEAIRKHLLASDLLKGLGVRPDVVAVSVDVAAYNSKRFYIIVSGPKGDEVFVFPVTGNDTVLDAIAKVAGLSERLGEAELTITRPHGGGQAEGKPWDTLPVDWAAIKQGDEATNHQIKPGDRLYVKPKAEPVRGSSGSPGRP